MKLYKEVFNMDVFKFSFANRVIDKWNTLPEDIIRTTSMHSFAINWRERSLNKHGPRPENNNSNPVLFGPP